VSGGIQQSDVDEKARAGRRWIADNDDELPDEICRIIDAMARAAARRDHYAATKGSYDRD
jgi:hypothetical protein